MDVVEHLHGPRVRPQRRKSARYEVQCRARIVIGRRHYAGYIHNISQGGAKLRTITPIRNAGEVLLTLPDLRPLRCRLRWTGSHIAGVEFEPALSRADLLRWAATRSAVGVPASFDEWEVGEAVALAQLPAGAELNHAGRERLQGDDIASGDGTVMKERVMGAQRGWLRYRAAS